MRLLHLLLSRFMRRVENEMIRRLLHQREAAWRQADYYRAKLGMKLGEFDDTDKGKP